MNAALVDQPEHSARKWLTAFSWQAPPAASTAPALVLDTAKAEGDHRGEAITQIVVDEVASAVKRQASSY